MTSILATLCLDWAYSINALTGFLFKAAKLSEVRSRLSGPGGGAIWGLPVTGNDWNGRGRPWLDIGWWDWVFPVRVTWSNSRGCWDINLFSGVGKTIFWDESEIKNFQIILHKYVYHVYDELLKIKAVILNWIIDEVRNL